MTDEYVPPDNESREKLENGTTAAELPSEKSTDKGFKDLCQEILDVHPHECKDFMLERIKADPRLGSLLRQIIGMYRIFSDLFDEETARYLTIAFFTGSSKIPDLDGMVDQ